MGLHQLLHLCSGEVSSIHSPPKWMGRQVQACCFPVQLKLAKPKKQQKPRNSVSENCIGKSVGSVIFIKWLANDNMGVSSFR